MFHAIQVRRVAERLADKKMQLELDESALDHLARVGYDPVFGARYGLSAVLETPAWARAEGLSDILLLAAVAIYKCV